MPVEHEMAPRPREIGARDDVGVNRLGRDHAMGEAVARQEIGDEFRAGARVARRVARIDAGEILQETDQVFALGLDAADEGLARIVRHGCPAQ